MWKRVVVKDFQRHAVLTVPFGPGVTTIVGSSEAGKSAVVRALRWVCFNRPAGSGMVRNGTSAAAVVLVTVAGKFLRRKGKGVNLYAVDGRKLVAFGSDVPEPVRDGLGVGPENFGRQHDPPFWITLPPGELAKRLNRITGLDEAERVKAALVTKGRRLAAEVRVLDESVKGVKRIMVEIERFAPYMKAAAAARRTAALYDETARSSTILAALCETLSNANGAKDGAESLVQSLADVLATGERLRAAARRASLLDTLIGRADTVPPGVSDLDASLAAWVQARKESAHAYARRGLMEHLIDDYLLEDRAWRTLDKKRRRLERDAAVCPTCLRPLPTSR